MKIPVIALALIIGTRCLAAPYNVVLVTDDTTNLFWKFVYTGAAKAKEDLKAQGVDVNLTWDGPANNTDDMEEARIVEKKIAEKVDGIVLSPAHAVHLVKPVAGAAKAGIPVVVINAGLGSAGQISFVSTDNYKGGSLAAHKIGALLHGKGKVVIFRWLAGNAASGARETGFLETIKSKFPGIKIISEDRYANGNFATAQKVAAEIVKTYGAEADAIFTPTQVTTQTMLAALRETGMTKGKPIFIGFDSDDTLLSALHGGEIQGLIVQNPMMMGYKGVMTVVDHIKGKPIEKEIDTGCSLVTAETMDQPAVKEILHPPVEKYVK